MSDLTIVNVFDAALAVIVFAGIGFLLAIAL
jgi:hypothetical protein